MTEVTDADLKELLTLEASVRLMNVRIKEIKEACKQIGSFTTQKHMCAVIEQQRTGLVGLSTVELALGRELLNAHNLIQTTAFLVVKVVPLSAMSMLA